MVTMNLQLSTFWLSFHNTTNHRSNIQIIYVIQFSHGMSIKQEKLKQKVELNCNHFRWPRQLLTAFQYLSSHPKIGAALTSNLSGFFLQQVETITERCIWSKFGKQLHGDPHPIWHACNTIPYLRLGNAVKEGVERWCEPEDGTSATDLACWQAKEAAPMKLQRCGCLNKTWMMTTPIDRTLWMGRYHSLDP